MKNSILPLSHSLLLFSLRLGAFREIIATLRLAAAYVSQNKTILIESILKENIYG